MLVTSVTVASNWEAVAGRVSERTTKTKKLLHTPAPEAPPLLLSLRFPFASPVFSSLSLPCRRSASGGPSCSSLLQGELRVQRGMPGGWSLDAERVWFRLVRSDFRVWQEAPLLLVGSIARGVGSAVSSVLLRDSLSSGCGRVLEPAVLACGAGSAAVSKVVVYGLFDAVLLTPS
ncbi:hypothetical protein DY000_02059304 [Brassica cretica]|uniref:Uncharacterized protein n=1 Tax=Brassica cretica TaxID=69181 RepID=A0ABQ7AYG6_BRACR|nr:hypothetical protein DY000_02059304 [Brassica cretica]